MTIDLKRLEKHIKKVKLEVENTTTKKFREVALEVDRALVFATPVDTGRARSNWIPSIGTSSKTIKEKPNDLSQILTDAQLTVDKAKLGDTIYFTNNLPYISRLNEGSSAQAPAGFVEKAVQAAKARNNK